MSEKNSFLTRKVNVVLSINQEEVNRNITENLKQIPNWFGEIFYPNGFRAFVISAGPSMEKYVEELNLKERLKDPKRDFVVFCVKHSLPRLLEMGVVPDFCVILDGRDVNQNSTHGISRIGLFKKIPDKTIFLVASMSHPGYAKYLMFNGARILGWHTAVQGLKEFQDKGMLGSVPIISGGTSSGTRCISIANALGIKDVTLIGFDSCIHNPTKEQLVERDDKGRIKYIPIDLPVKNPQADNRQREIIDELEAKYLKEGFVYQSTLSRRYHTTGELLAQSQDFETIFTNTMFDTKFTVLDDGIVSHMFNNMPNVVRRSYSFVEYLKNISPRRNISNHPRRDITLGKTRKEQGGVTQPLVGRPMGRLPLGSSTFKTP